MSIADRPVRGFPIRTKPSSRAADAGHLAEIRIVFRTCICGALPGKRVASGRPPRTIGEKGMPKHFRAVAMGLGCSLVLRTACAFYDPPYITPEHPVAGDVVSVNIYGGICDSLFVGLVPPRLTQNGNALRILFWSVHYDDFEWCNLGVGTRTYPLGSFAPGFYTLQVDRFDHLLLSGEPDPETLGTVSFTVTRSASPPASAPTLSPVGSTLLLFTLVALAARWLRSTRRTP